MREPRSRYRNYLSLFVLVMLGVILSFRMIPDRKTAGAVAGALFLFSSLFVLFYEMRKEGFLRQATFWGVLVFLLFSVLPIWILRFLDEDIDFANRTLFGITGAQMHNLSNKVFVIMILSIVVDIVRDHKRKLEQKNKEANG